MTDPNRQFGAAVLFVAHPGHELCLHGWLERTHARVFVLTDGSGATGRSRLPSTSRLVEQCGAEPGSVFGRFSDADMYRIILEGDVDPVVAVVRELADALTARDDAYLVADPWELYNPSHDLCRVIADLSRALASVVTGRSIDGFDYLLTSGSRQETPAVTVDLDDEALARKFLAADAYTELRAEVASAIERFGAASLRRECLYAVAADARLDPPGTRPFYEVYGEKRVASGGYATVLRYDEHFLPFVTVLASAVGVPSAQSVAAAGGVG